MNDGSDLQSKISSIKQKALIDESPNCPSCSGEGSFSESESCRTCYGTGEHEFGYSRMVTCRTCNGSGSVHHSYSCEFCKGYGRFSFKVTFQAESNEEAREKAELFTQSVTAFSRVQVVQEVNRQSIVSRGRTREQAVASAQAMVPGHAFNIGDNEIMQEGQTGIVDLRAYSENDARKQWMAAVPSGADLDVFTCIEPPKGFLWFNRTKGLWKAHWSRLFIVRIAYDLPAAVAVWCR